MLDAHVHVVSDDDGAFPLSPAAHGTFWFSDTRRLTVEDLLAGMDAAGVDKVAIVHCFPAYSYDCRYTVEASHRHPDRCRSVVQVDPTDPRADELFDTYAADPLVTGLRILALFDADLLGAKAARLWAGAKRADLTVEFVVDGLDGVVEVVAAAAPVRVVLHGVLPELMTLFTERPDPRLAALAALDNCALKVSTGVIETLGFVDEPAPLARVTTGLFGANRVTWGTNFPATQSMSYAQNIALGQRFVAELAPAEQDAVLAGTAERLWRF